MKPLKNSTYGGPKKGPLGSTKALAGARPASDEPPELVGITQERGESLLGPSQLSLLEQSQLHHPDGQG